jgi:hypothetical protein
MSKKLVRLIRKENVRSSGKQRRALPRLSTPYTLTWNGPGFLPENFLTTVIATDDYVETTAGGFVDWVYKNNDVYDPDAGIGGISAMGHANMSYLYTHDKVLASTAEVSVSTQANSPIIVTLTATRDGMNSAFSSAKAEAIPALPYSKTMRLCKTDGVKTLRNSVDIAQMFGVRDLDSVNFQTAVGSSPATVGYWHLTITDMSAAALNCYWTLKIKYRTLYTGLNLSAFEQ